MSSHCETPEIAAMSMLCPCVQYGITHAEDQGKSTWIPFTFTYLLHSLGYNLLALALIGSIAPPEIWQLASVTLEQEFMRGEPGKDSGESTELPDALLPVALRHCSHV